VASQIQRNSWNGSVGTPSNATHDAKATRKATLPRARADWLVPVTTGLSVVTAAKMIPFPRYRCPKAPDSKRSSAIHASWTPLVLGSGRMFAVLVISRFRYDVDATEKARADLALCLEELGRLPGFLTGAVGRALDDPSLWVLQTRWENVGSYRRALSSYEVKVAAVPLLSQALDEPSAYEIVIGEGATELNDPRPRQL
jgi:quinol monooxygenase YgiN